MIVPEAHRENSFVGRDHELALLASVTGRPCNKFVAFSARAICIVLFVNSRRKNHSHDCLGFGQRSGDEGELPANIHEYSKFTRGGETEQMVKSGVFTIWFLLGVKFKLETQRPVTENTAEPMSSQRLIEQSKIPLLEIEPLQCMIASRAGLERFA